jgi:hypothetical protein
MAKPPPKKRIILLSNVSASFFGVATILTFEGKANESFAFLLLNTKRKNEKWNRWTDAPVMRADIRRPRAYMLANMPIANSSTAAHIKS